MPQGPGTYGNKRGRPKKKNNRRMIMDAKPEINGGPNVQWGGVRPKPPVRPSSGGRPGRPPRPVGSRPIPGARPPVGRPPVRPSNGSGRPGQVRPGITTKPGTYTPGRPVSRPIPSNKGPLKEAHSIGLPEERKTKRRGRRSPTNVGAKGSRRRSAPPSRVEQRRKERRSGFKMRRGVNL